MSKPSRLAGRQFRCVSALSTMRQINRRRRSRLFAATVDWVVSGGSTPRLKQHAVEPELARITELRESDRHIGMSGPRLGTIGAE
jgi:hypothetical protein